MIDITRGRELLTAQIGKPYIFGYEVDLNDPNPKAFDCSELIEWFFHQLGFAVPDGTWQQYRDSVAVDSPMDFDVNFLLKNGKTPFHVVIKLDENMIVQARGSSYGVIKEPIDQFLTRDAKLTSGWRRFKCLQTA